MEESSKKSRLPNFSASDCLLLCEIMAEGSCVACLSNYAYLRHRFTSCITSSSKKKLWMEVEIKFNRRSEQPRECAALQKKWDNLVQVHRALYADFLREQHMTGGGPCPKTLSPITDAVISVIGKQSAGVKGISNFVDSTMMQMNSLSASSQAECPISSASTKKQRVQIEDQDVYDEDSRASFSDTNLLSESTECIERNALSSKYSAVQVVCCQCNCHRQLEILKEEKLRLQIRVLKRQLGEE